METFPTNQLTLEGPDLAGKTSLYNVLHKNTNFKWNIQDRSSLSMLCYARLYGRSTHKEQKRLQDELNNLNNRMIVLMPSFATIEERYHHRGDEFQNLDSLRKLYNIFAEETQKIRKRPNVMCLTEDDDVESLSMYVSEWSYALESCRAWHVGEVVKDTLNAVDENELTLTANLVYSAEVPNSEILNNELEGEYYSNIKNTVERIITDEIEGKNPYNLPQTAESRRFFYNSDTCISGIHFLPRADTMKVIVFLRSTDVIKNASIDLQFIEYLTQYVNQQFSFDCSMINLMITLNSAHVRRDLE